MAQAPTAITIFGAWRRPRRSAASAVFHVFGYRPGDQKPVGMARRRDKLDAEPSQVEHDRAQHVDVGLAGIAAAGADLTAA